jgi:hypothetical protein
MNLIRHTLNPDIAEDRRRLDEFNRTKEAVSLDDVKAWVASWGTAAELPRPRPRKRLAGDRAGKSS